VRPLAVAPGSASLSPISHRGRRIHPVQSAVLGGALDSSGGSLVNINVLDPVVVLVLLDIQSDGREADRLARQPANALLHVYQFAATPLTGERQRTCVRTSSVSSESVLSCALSVPCHDGRTEGKHHVELARQV
jgi:hypothetical protein